MASSNFGSSPPGLEELNTRSATALLLPWIIGMAPATDSASQEVAVFLHRSTQSITVIEGSLDFESILREISYNRDGPLPASKASIESLPVVRISDPGLECPICLVEFKVNGEPEVKEMPCCHRFHSGCIDKWLGINGSCPVCRFSMPVEEESDGTWWRIRVSFNPGRREPGTVAGADSGNGENDTGGDGNVETAQQMEIDMDE